MQSGRLVGIVTQGDLVALDADLHFPYYIQFLDSLIYLESRHKFEERLRKAVGAFVKDVMTDGRAHRHARGQRCARWRR